MDFVELRQHMNLKPYRTGCVDKQETWRAFWLFKGTPDKNELAEWMELNHIYRYSDGAGSGYASKPYIISNGFRTLVAQHGGLDV